MKKLLLCATIAVAMCFASCEGFDASDILDRLNNLENQLDDLKGNGSDSGSDDNSGNNGGDNQGGNNDENGNGSEGETVSQLNKIYYTTADNTKLFPKTDASLYGAILISNTYKDGQGIMVFDDVVTSIGERAFYYCTSLTSVTIPNSVNEIGYQAFYECIRLTSATIGNRVTSIGDEAFYYCTSLASVTIPNSVTSIGNWAFYYCTSLTSVTIGNRVTSIGNWAFDGCASLESVTIPDGVTSIGYEAFYRCTSLTEVYCKPTTPPTGDSNLFGNKASGFKIYVSRNSVSAYKSAQYWSNYASYIYGYDFNN